MAMIGTDIIGSGVGRTNEANFNTDPLYIYTAVTDDRVTSVSALGKNPLGDILIGVYDITGGAFLAPLVGDARITTTAVNQWASVPLDIALTAGNTYAVAVGTAGNIGVGFVTVATDANKVADILGALPVEWQGYTANEQACSGYATVGNFAPEGPAFIDPGSIAYKVSAAVTEDASGWFASDTTLTNFRMTGAPAELSIDNTTGAITGTLTVSQTDFTATITCTNDTLIDTSGDVQFVISPYYVLFYDNDSSRLRASDGALQTISGTVQVSVFPGTIATMSGAGEHFANQSILTGDLSLTLTTGPGDYVAVLVDTSTDPYLPLGSYEKTAV